MSSVQARQPRQTVQIQLPDGRVFEGPKGTPLETFIHAAEQAESPSEAGRAIAAVIDNRLRELTIPILQDESVRPISLLNADGLRIYRRSLAFLLVAAAHRLFPEAQIFIEHSLPQHGYFCRVENHPPFTEADLKRIQDTMAQMVAANLPIQRTQMSLDEARRYFTERGDNQKLRLLEYRTRDYIRVYQLEDFSDYFFGYMVPSTGYLKWFALEAAEDAAGFALLYPNEAEPTVIEPRVKFKKLEQVFRQADEWLRLLEVQDIGQLNTAIEAGHLKELILVAEALHERRIAEIGQEITQRHHEGVRLILIAGPSSSGKTTFSKRLAVQLMTHGLKPFTLELDNYFVDRELTPRDESGEYDFEALETINLPLFNQQLAALIAGEVVELPRFDFLTGKSVAGPQVQLSEDHMLIVEGIHGLNPALTPAIPPEKTYRIYVSALTQLNIDRYNRVSTTDVRLLRRIVRDATYRGWSAVDTLARWASVGRGERKNIFPYQERADVMFNSALLYEMAVMRPLAEPHLLRVGLDNPYWAEANRLLSFLSWVYAAPSEGLPDNSLLREFVGGSNLHDYHPGAS